MDGRFEAKPFRGEPEGHGAGTRPKARIQHRCRMAVLFNQIDALWVALLFRPFRKDSVQPGPAPSCACSNGGRVGSTKQVIQFALGVQCRNGRPPALASISFGAE